MRNPAEPCRYTDHLAESFARLFPEISAPDPMPEVEASEGIVALPEDVQ